VASKTVKTLKVPGAKMPKIGTKLPSVPKAPQLNNNLKSYMTASKMPKGGF
jgi:hypothetical protein